MLMPAIISICAVLWATTAAFFVSGAYCVTRRELLALVLAVRHFRTYLNSKRFLSRTNHVSLTLLLSFKNPESQDARWLEALQ